MCRQLDKNYREEITALFASAFGASEGEQEGKLIADLAASLITSHDHKEILCMGSFENECLIGVVFFSRLRFKAPVQVYMLSPVAIETEHQGKGHGQSLINYGLKVLRKRAVEVVVTYGDPNYYAKVGFQPISDSLINAPFALSMPHGWLGQSLTEESIPTLSDCPVCVDAFNNPAYW